MTSQQSTTKIVSLETEPLLMENFDIEIQFSYELSKTKSMK